MPTSYPVTVGGHRGMVCPDSNEVSTAMTLSQVVRYDWDRVRGAEFWVCTLIVESD